MANILKHGRHIANSPFKIRVSYKEIGNASRVKAHGKGLTERKTNELELDQLVVDTKDAGSFLVFCIYILIQDIIIFYFQSKQQKYMQYSLSAWNELNSRRWLSGSSGV